MKEIHRDDWVFIVDEKRTKDFYAENIKINLPEERNVLPSLAAFFDEFGVDICKPIDYSEHNDDLCFVVFGRAQASDAGGYELDFYEPEHMASIVVYLGSDMNDELIAPIRKNEDTDILLFEVFVC